MQMTVRPPHATYGNQPSLTTTLTLENGLTTTTQRDAAYQITSHHYIGTDKMQKKLLACRAAGG
jgi:hypothetical protein